MMESISTLVAVGLGTLVLMYVLHYVKNITCRRYCKSDANLTGKTVIVTGSNSGIGKVAAQNMARRGARVILACRSLQKAEDAAKEIKTRTGNSEVVARHLDLASLLSVRKFADMIIESESRLDILINNAGVVIVQEGAITEENFHLVFGTNHFGPFLLTNLLLDLLKKSTPSRVVFVSSNAHRYLSGPFDLARDRGAVSGNTRVLYPHLKGYGHSKLANILFSRELAKRLESTGVISISLHPGIIYTTIWKNMTTNCVMKILYYFATPFLWLFCLDEEVGAQTTLYCALDESIPRLSGLYFANCTVVEESPIAQDDELARRLWDISCQATGFE